MSGEGVTTDASGLRQASVNGLHLQELGKGKRWLVTDVSHPEGYEVTGTLAVDRSGESFTWIPQGEDATRFYLNGARDITTDGALMRVGADGRITETLDANKRWSKYYYDSNGSLSHVDLSEPSTSRADGILRRMYQREENGTWSLVVRDDRGVLQRRPTEQEHSPSIRVRDS